MEGQKVNQEAGFTFIELMVVLTIIAILAGMGLSQFQNYRARTFNALALSDLKNVINAQEAYYTDFESYITCATGVACASVLPGFHFSENVVLNVQSAGATFTGESLHPMGTETYNYDSATGEFTH
ncbi:type II secretion system protein [bacterium]|nr:type II secretion system protein [bacterium]